MNADPVSADPSSNPPEWWTSARFGLFIHWGFYAVPAGEYRARHVAGASEWLMHSEHIPIAEYKTFAAGFTAEHYDAGEWVRLAQETGMGYVGIGAKHHDGFALFSTTSANPPPARPARNSPLPAPWAHGMGAACPPPKSAPRKWSHQQIFVNP